MLVNAGKICAAMILAVSDWVRREWPMQRFDAHVFSHRVVGAALQYHSRWRAVRGVRHDYQLFPFPLRDVSVGSRSSFDLFLYPLAYGTTCFGLRAIFPSPISSGDVNWCGCQRGIFQGHAWTFRPWNLPPYLFFPLCSCPVRRFKKKLKCYF